MSAHQIGLTAFLWLAYASSMAQCDQPYSWVIWDKFDGYQEKATGTITIEGKSIRADISATYGIELTNEIYEAKRFATYPDYGKINMNNVPRVAWAKGKESVTTTCFSEPVTNPVLLISSLGSFDGTRVTLRFPQPYTVLHTAGVNEFPDAFTIRGTEGYSLLLFQGTYTCINFTADRYEYSSDITWGARPSAFPVQVSAPTMGCGLTSVTATGGVSYRWSGGRTPTKPDNTFDRDGFYTVAVTDQQGCTAYGQAGVVVSLVACPPNVFVANAFTPNQDGQNDAFMPVVDHGTILSLSVYDRWGNRVHWEENSQPTWDGTYLGAACPAGMYSYSLVYQTPNQQLKKQGSVQLIR